MGKLLSCLQKAMYPLKGDGKNWTANLLHYRNDCPLTTSYIYLPWKVMERFGLQICYTTEMSPFDY